MRGDVRRNELVEKMIPRSAREAEQSVIRKPAQGPRGVRIVQGGKFVGRRVAQNIRVIELPFSVVALAVNAVPMAYRARERMVPVPL